MTAIRFGLAPLALLAAIPSTFAAEAFDAGDGDLEQIVVTAAVNPVTSSATGVPLTLMETPQSVTVIQQDLIQTRALTNVNDLLDQVPGINVERNETDRTMYDARGFDITNFQVDSIGLPMIDWLTFGQIDTVLWDRVEVVRGTNGLTTGVGGLKQTCGNCQGSPGRTHGEIPRH